MAQSFAKAVELQFKHLERYFNNGSTRGIELMMNTFEREIKKNGLIPVYTGATRDSTRVYMGGRGSNMVTKSGIVKGFRAQWLTHYAGFIYPYGGPFVPWGNRNVTNPEQFRTGTPYWGIQYMNNNRKRLAQILSSTMSDTLKKRTKGSLSTVTKTLYINL